MFLSLISPLAFLMVLAVSQSLQAMGETVLSSAGLRRCTSVRAKMPRKVGDFIGQFLTTKERRALSLSNTLMINEQSEEYNCDIIGLHLVHTDSLTPEELQPLIKIIYALETRGISVVNKDGKYDIKNLFFISANEHLPDFFIPEDPSKALFIAAHTNDVLKAQVALACGANVNASYSSEPGAGIPALPYRHDNHVPMPVLVRAIRQGSAAVASLLIADDQTDINIPLDATIALDRNTPLYLLIEKIAIADAEDKKYLIDTAKKIIRARPHDINIDGGAAFRRSAFFGLDDVVVEFLKNAELDVNASTNSGITALMEAAIPEFPCPKVSIVKLLLADSRTNPLLSTSAYGCGKQTVLTQALKRLSQSGAYKKEHLEVVRLLIADTRNTAEHLQEVLAKAVCCGIVDIVYELMANYPVDINIPWHGFVLLNKAIEYAFWHKDDTLALMLIADSRTNINAESSCLSRPLFVAAVNYHCPTILAALLARHDLDMSAKNYEGETALVALINNPFYQRCDNKLICNPQYVTCVKILLADSRTKITKEVRNLVLDSLRY
ncbi:hypothetical protein FJ365_04035 [Candidatus Dependentiae bacterium]|nr:hypothetical protein [Candidatus Dependentiae bacterium]